MTTIYTWIVEIRHLDTGDIEEIEIEATTSWQAEQIAAGNGVMVLSSRLKEN